MTFEEQITNAQWLYLDGSTSVGAPNRPPSPGDRYVLRFDLLQAGQVVGFVNVQCTYIFNDNELCNSVNSVTGKGDFMQSGLIRSHGQGPPVVFDLAVTGGTFGFRGVHGDAHHQNTGPGTDTLTLTLN